MLPKLSGSPEASAGQAARPPVRISARGWGLDIGLRSLKAIRLGYDPDGDRAIAMDVDCVAYPPGPGAAGEDLERRAGEALVTFRERNDLGSDPIAVAVPEQSGLMRFCEIPPVDDSRLDDLVRYEARFQIPVAIEEVAWDYQRLVRIGEGAELDLLCLFAVRLDQFQSALAPLEVADLVADIVQLKAVALANFAAFALAADASPTPTALLDIRSDQTEIVVIDRERVGHRRVSVGGEHFTKALAAGLKLGSAQAEQLKRFIAQAADPREPIAAMRGAFQELAREVDRAVRPMVGAERRPQYVLMGEGSRLMALPNVLAKLLDRPVELLDGLGGVDCGAIAEAAAFRRWRPSFATACGLALQALGLGRFGTSLTTPDARQRKSRGGPFAWLTRARK
jgi:type IV pilus assembly protein PilM